MNIQKKHCDQNIKNLIIHLYLMKMTFEMDR
jgi:hypothetical protein